MIRQERVIIDADLAKFYGVSTKRLNEQVKRNRERFPIDFMFQLSVSEKLEVVANCDHLNKLKFSSTLPNVFTEHGAIMAANVLNSPQAIELGVFVVRAFVNLRRGVIPSQELTAKLTDLEIKLVEHDQKLVSIVHAIKVLMGKKKIPPRRQIGFGADDLDRE